jgi:acetyl-CoA carboxylase biotin carboxylase subunit
LLAAARHQKVWEEAPSPALNDSERAKIGKVVADAIANMGYSGAGTIEFSTRTANSTSSR